MKKEFVDISLQILISSRIFGSSILKIFACGALKSLRERKCSNFRACGGLTAPRGFSLQAIFCGFGALLREFYLIKLAPQAKILQFQSATKGILPYKIGAFLSSYKICRHLSTNFGELVSCKK